MRMFFHCVFAYSETVSCGCIARGRYLFRARGVVALGPQITKSFPFFLVFKHSSRCVTLALRTRSQPAHYTEPSGNRIAIMRHRGPRYLRPDSGTSVNWALGTGPNGPDTFKRHAKQSETFAHRAH